MLHKQIWREKTLPGGSGLSWSLVNNKQTNSSDILISMNLYSSEIITYEIGTWGRYLREIL